MDGLRIGILLYEMLCGQPPVVAVCGSGSAATFLTVTCHACASFFSCHLICLTTLTLTLSVGTHQTCAYTTTPSFPPHHLQGKEPAGAAAADHE